MPYWGNYLHWVKGALCLCSNFLVYIISKVFSLSCVFSLTQLLWLILVGEINNGPLESYYTKGRQILIWLVMFFNTFGFFSLSSVERTFWSAYSLVKHDYYFGLFSEAYSLSGWLCFFSETHATYGNDNWMTGQVFIKRGVITTNFYHHHFATYWCPRTSLI